MGELCDSKRAKLVGISFRIRTGHTRNRGWIAGGEEHRLLTLRLSMSYIYIYIYIYIYGAPILDVSRSHTATQHSR